MSKRRTLPLVMESKLKYNYSGNEEFDTVVSSEDLKYLWFWCVKHNESKVAKQLRFKNVSIKGSVILIKYGINFL